MKGLTRALRKPVQSIRDSYRLLTVYNSQVYEGFVNANEGMLGAHLGRLERYVEVMKRPFLL